LINGSVTVYLLQGDEPSILIHGKKSIVKQVETSIKNRVLTISKNYTLSDERVNVYLTVTNINNIKTSGEVIIETPTNIWLNKLSLDLDNETEVTLFVNSNDLNLEVEGSGSLELSGYIDTLRIAGSEESEISGKIKSLKFTCRANDFSYITMEGTIFRSYISSFDNSFVDLNNCEVGMSSIVAFGESTVKTTSIDATDIYAFDKSAIHYRSENQAFVLEQSNKASVKKDLIKSIASK
jgi:hypothetical protein